jgi:uncharacterized protein with PhoU and TrkA domain
MQTSSSRRWQQLAAEALLAAKQMADPEARQIILGVALAYERVAAHARRQELKALTKLPKHVGDKLN